MKQHDNLTYVQTALKAALLAGDAILQVYQKPFAVDYKADRSPLTEADCQSHQVITEILRQFNDAPILSEEGRSIDFVDRRDWSGFWLVDPLDGTKEFVKRNGEFTVNIAWISQGAPSMGVVYAPVSRICYWGLTGHGAFQFSAPAGIDQAMLSPQALSAWIEGGAPLTRRANDQPLMVVASRSHPSPALAEFTEQLKSMFSDVSFRSVGSSLKICLVASGAADIYPRLGPTMEWDTGAGQALVEAGGGQLLSLVDGLPLRYNKPCLRNPGFVVLGPHLIAHAGLHDLIGRFCKGGEFHASDSNYGQ